MRSQPGRADMWGWMQVGEHVVVNDASCRPAAGGGRRAGSVITADDDEAMVMGWCARRGRAAMDLHHRHLG